MNPEAFKLTKIHNTSVLCGWPFAGPFPLHLENMPGKGILATPKPSEVPQEIPPDAYHYAAQLDSQLSTIQNLYFLEIMLIY